MSRARNRHGHWRHCEERSDAAIQCGLDCFASLAMTATQAEIYV